MTDRIPASEKGLYSLELGEEFGTKTCIIYFLILNTSIKKFVKNAVT